MKTQKIKSRKTWYANGVIKSSEIEMNTDDFEKFKRERIQDAKILESSGYGVISTQQNHSFLYISYLGLANTNKIDQIYVKS